MKTKFLILLFIFPTFILAQKSINDIANYKEGKWKKEIKSYRNYSTSIDQLEGLMGINVLKKENLPNPKKIGILTFQLWDESVTTSTKTDNYIYYTKHFLTDNGSNAISNKLLTTMLPVLEQKFSEKGIELLEPKEYLTSAEKEEIYYEGKNNVKVGGLVKFLSNGFFRMLLGERKGQGSTSADGYAFYPITPKLISADIKSPGQIGKIAEQLGLDAVLIISVDTSIERGGKSLTFRGLEMAIVGPINDETNIPTPKIIGRKMLDSYRDGLTFSKVLVPSEMFEMAKMKKKNGEIEEWYLKGLDKLTARVADDLLVGLEKFGKLDKSKK